jgi:hypothetical protein
VSMLLALTLAQASAPAAEDQIVVMAQRIRSIEVAVVQDQAGAWHCSLSATSGNARVDESLCRTTTECTQRHGNERDLIMRCVERRRPGILDDFRRSVRRNRAQ